MPQDVFGRSSVQASGVDSRTAGFAARVTAADAPGRYSADDTRGGGVVGVAHLSFCSIRLRVSSSVVNRMHSEQSSLVPPVARRISPLKMALLSSIISAYLTPL